MDAIPNVLKSPENIATILVGSLTTGFQLYVSVVGFMGAEYGDADALNHIVAGKTGDTNATGYCEGYWRGQGNTNAEGKGTMGESELNYFWSMNIFLIIGSLFTLFYYIGRHVVAADTSDRSGGRSSGIVGDVTDVVVRVLELVYMISYAGFIYLLLFFTTTSSCALAATNAGYAIPALARSAPLWNQMGEYKTGTPALEVSPSNEYLWNGTLIDVLVAAIAFSTLQFVHLLLLDYDTTRSLVVFKTNA